MSRLMLVPIDMGKLEILNPRAQQLASAPGSPVTGQFYYNTTSNCVEFWNGTIWITVGRMDQLDPPTTSVDLNTQKIVNLAAPTGANDAARKVDVDAVSAGINWKAAVRAATIAQGTLATAYANGSVIDGVTLATGDRILIKDQTAGGENGVYTVNASGAPTRALDVDTATEILQAAVFIQEGTINADGAWVNTTNAPITLNTTATVWTLFTGIVALIAGAGLTKTGSTVDAIAGATPGSGGPGGGLKVNADDIVVDTAIVVRKFAVDVGTGAATSIVVTHNLNTKDVTVGVFDNTTPFAEAFCDVQHTSVNTITLVFAVAPTTAQYRCVVHG